MWEEIEMHTPLELDAIGVIVTAVKCASGSTDFSLILNYQITNSTTPTCHKSLLFAVFDTTWRKSDR